MKQIRELNVQNTALNNFEKELVEDVKKYILLEVFGGAVVNILWYNTE